MHQTNLIIGITGKAGSGKDTIADHLVSQHGFTRLAFADKLKQIVADIYDVPLAHFNDRELKKQDHPNLCRDYIMQKYNRDELTIKFAQVIAEMQVFNPEDTMLYPYQKIAQTIFVDLMQEQPVSPRRALQMIGTEGFRTHVGLQIWIDYVMRCADNLQQQGVSVVISDVRFPNELAAVAKQGFNIGVVRGAAEHYDHSSEQHIDAMLLECETVLCNDKSIAELLRASNEVVAHLRDDINRLQSALMI